MIKQSILYFPELNNKTITVGLTQRHGILGEADNRQFLIRLAPHKISFNTIGHELTHLAQRATHGSDFEPIPYGEKQCDIWTLARGDIFTDRCPGYLAVPRWMQARWNELRYEVRQMCINSIDQRKNGNKKYIKWLESALASYK